MEIDVNQRMKPESKFSKESRVEAIIAREPLLTQAYTLAANMTMFIIFDIWMANFSPFLMLSRSSCNK
jgi:hypothetical protein